MHPVTALNEVIYKFKRYKQNDFDERDYWRLVDAVRGVQIFGGIGSGKSSGSGRDLALTFLKSGFGGIVLTGKVDEKDRWEEYFKDTPSRSDHDRIVFEPGGKYKFNPLKYELERAPEQGGGYTDNIVSLFMSIVKMGNRIDGSSEGAGKEPFWILAMERCIKASVDLLKLAKKGKDLEEKSKVEFIVTNQEFNPISESGHLDLTINNIAKVLRDTPTGNGHYNKFFKLNEPDTSEHHKQLQAWANESYTVYCLVWAAWYITCLEEKLNVRANELKQLKTSNTYEYERVLPKFKKQQEHLESNSRTFDVISSYFLSELSTLAEKTRSSILEHFFAFAAPFRSGLLADYFAMDTSDEILPERTFEGKVIILNFPVKKYLQLGVYAQAIYKKLWQQAVERRKVGKMTRPVFIWIDEAQYFINQDDVMFQTTARSSKACTVLISQNISNYYATIGGANSKALVDSLLGNLATKIFHNNNDHVTNEWASNTIEKDYRNVQTTSDTKVSISKEYQYQFLPKNFTLLKTGGERNDRKIHAVITVADKKWSNDKNFVIASFQQKEY